MASARRSEKKGWIEKHGGSVAGGGERKLEM
jgi:hypothetical protein